MGQETRRTAVSSPEERVEVMVGRALIAGAKRTATERGGSAWPGVEGASNQEVIIIIDDVILEPGRPAVR